MADPGGGALESLIRDLSQEIAALRKLVESQQQRTVFENRLRDNYLASVTQASQLLLQGHYQRLYAEGKPLPSLADVEFRCHSQNGEDGIIHYVFSLVGAGPKKAVEICAGDGLECNSANLIQGAVLLLCVAGSLLQAGGRERVSPHRAAAARLQRVLPPQGSGSGHLPRREPNELLQNESALAELGSPLDSQRRRPPGLRECDRSLR